MTLVALVVGIVLLAVTHGTVQTVGEIVAIVAGVLISIQLLIFAVAVRVAIKTGQSYHQKFF